MNAVTVHDGTWKGIIGVGKKMLISSIETNSAIKKTINSIRPTPCQIEVYYIIIKHSTRLRHELTLFHN